MNLKKRHPACGYVQGMNEIATPFIAVFLSEYIKLDFEKFSQSPEVDKLSDETL